MRLQHEILPEGIFTATEPYLKEHLIKGEDDYRVVEYILERAEFVPLFDKIAAEQDTLGDIAFVAPLLHRIPFQQVLLEYIGELNLFYALYDNPARVQRLLELLDEQMLEILDKLADFPWVYVEFPDNLHSLMTNPKLFAQYCLPAFPALYPDPARAGKVVGSHTDGEVKPLLGLLKESGLDVCESLLSAAADGLHLRRSLESMAGKTSHLGRHPLAIIGRER